MGPGEGQVDADLGGHAHWWPWRSWEVAVISARERASMRRGGLGPSQRFPHFLAGLKIAIPKRGLDSHTKSGRRESTQGRKGSSSGPRRGKAW